MSEYEKTSTLKVDDIDVIMPADDSLINIKIASEDINEDKIVSHLLRLDVMDEDDRDALEYTTGKYSSKIYTLNGANVTTYPSGALIFGKDEFSDEEYVLTMEEAQKKVEEFIEENGGLPEDAYLEKIKAEIMTSVSTGEEIITGYTFVYKHRYNNLKIEGAGGDAIKVTIDNTDIPYYFRLWRNVVDECEPFILAENERNEKIKEIKQKAEESALSSIKSVEKPQIIEMRLTYWSNFFKGDQEYMPVVWEINTNLNKKVYVDFTTGELMKPEK